MTVMAEGEAFDPPYEAHRLRLSGLPWRDVAARTGYSSDIACSLAFKKYLQKAAIELTSNQRAERLQVELDRLDQLQSAWWDAAMAMDDKAAQVVLRIINQRAKLLGLEFEDKTQDKGGQTILLMGDKKDYINGIRALRELENPIEDGRDDNS